MKKSILIEIISILFAMLFLYAAIDILMDVAFFKRQVGDFSALKPITPFIAWFLPLSEIIVAVLLFVPAWRLRGFYGALALMILLTGYVILLLSFSKRLPGLINVPDFLSWKQQLVLNCILLVMAVMGIVQQRK